MLGLQDSGKDNSHVPEDPQTYSPQFRAGLDIDTRDSLMGLGKHAVSLLCLGTPECLSCSQPSFQQGYFWAASELWAENDQYLKGF